MMKFQLRTRPTPALTRVEMKSTLFHVPPGEDVVTSTDNLVPVSDG